MKIAVDVLDVLKYTVTDDDETVVNFLIGGASALGLKRACKEADDREMQRARSERIRETESSTDE